MVTDTHRIELVGRLKVAEIHLEVERTTDNTERQSYAKKKCREVQEAQRCLNTECKPRGGSLQSRGDLEAKGLLEVEQNQKLVRVSAESQSRELEPRARAEGQEPIARAKSQS